MMLTEVLQCVQQSFMDCAYLFSHELSNLFEAKSWVVCRRIISVVLLLFDNIEIVLKKCALDQQR